MSDPLEEIRARVGALHVTYEYASATAARNAWERVEKKAKGISCWRHMIPGEEGRHFVTVMGDDDEIGRAEVPRMERILREGSRGKRSLNEATFRSMRARRWGQAVNGAIAGKRHVATKLRYPERGVYMNERGVVEPRDRPQG